MDPNFNIYRDALENIPEADKARLDGFLAGRAEADAKLVAEERAAELQAQVEALEAKQRAGD